VKPLANFAKNRARQMMIQRAEKIGVPWRDEAANLRSQPLETWLDLVRDRDLVYPDYYLRSFHAYENGNLGWESATEVEVAAKAVHAGIWPDAGAEGDAKLRQSYHDIVTAKLPTPPRDIVDLGCSVGMSTFALQAVYPEANLTGVDLSPHFLAIAHYRSQQRNAKINWVHAAAESTRLPESSFDLVSLCLVCHELPQTATREIFREARRLLRPEGHIAIMDMNPQSEVYANMPPYILTLLKSTEPYLDRYFTLDIEAELVAAGFDSPTITRNSPRHRTAIAQVS
jgi:ubiquinone/menaquinone biosynthesis C-methylase UbiE